jgi:hypothetical protein
MAKIHIDLAEALGLGKDVGTLIALIVKAKKAKGPGGKKITQAERDAIEEALEELLEDAVEAVD